MLALHALSVRQMTYLPQGMTHFIKVLGDIPKHFTCVHCTSPCLTIVLSKMFVDVSQDCCAPAVWCGAAPGPPAPQNVAQRRLPGESNGEHKGGGGGREAGAAGRGVANALASTGKGEVQGKLAGVVGLLASIRKVGMQRQLAGVVEALARMGVGVVQG